MQTFVWNICPNLCTYPVMSNESKTTPKPETRRPAPTSREAKQAAALRANLRRRKADTSDTSAAKRKSDLNQRGPDD